jgi:hypothetical protein
MKYVLLLPLIVHSDFSAPRLAQGDGLEFALPAAQFGARQ